jgi:glyoxylate reductase
MRVLITRELPQAGLNILRQYRDIEIDYRQGAPLSETKLCEAIKGADAIIPVIPDQISKKVIAAAGKNLKVIATYSVGYDNIDLDTATKKEIYVANTPGNLTESVAEHALALIFAIARKIPEADRYCRAKQYKFWNPLIMLGPKLSEKTIGIIGFGRIGQQLGRMAKYGLGMKILYNDVMSHPEAEGLLDAEKVSLDYLLENSDIVSIHCNLTEETKHMIGSRQFKQMKPLAYLINTARGAIVHEEALVNALKTGEIAGAALDVFEDEPRISKELLTMDNVVLTPHIGSATWEARIQMARMAAENVVDVLINKKPPRYLVNKELIKGSVTSIL